MLDSRNHRTVIYERKEGSKLSPTIAPVYQAVTRQFLYIFKKFLFYFILFLAVLDVCCFVGFSLIVATGAPLQLQCSSFSMRWPLLLWTRGHAGFCSCSAWAQQLQLSGSGEQVQQLVEHGLSCSMVCGIFLDRGSNLCLLHWQVDSFPLSHQRSPRQFLVCSIGRWTANKSDYFTGLKNPVSSI